MVEVGRTAGVRRPAHTARRPTPRDLPWSGSDLLEVVRLPLDGNQPKGPVEDFATGWLNEQDQSASGRPVGLAVGPDGALYISDDKAGMIYRISYKGVSPG